MSEAYVYYWVDHKNDMWYIGSRKGKISNYDSSCKKLNEELKYRRDDFTRYIWDEGNWNDMYELESCLLQLLDAKNNPKSYNGHNNCEGFVNKGHTKETKQKIALAHQGKSKPPLSKKHKQKISMKLKGRAYMPRSPRSEEAKRKTSMAQKGKKREPMSLETKMKLSIAHTGKKLGPPSEETRRKIGEKNKIALLGNTNKRGKTKRRMN